MKEKIHPNYVEAKVQCACGNKFTTGSTKPVRKKCFHSRFTIAPEKNSFDGDVIQLASTTRGFCPGSIGVALRSNGRAAKNCPVRGWPTPTGRACCSVIRFSTSAMRRGNSSCFFFNSASCFSSVVLGNAASLGLSVHLLDRWADVDDGPSLDALRRRGHGSPAAATRRVLGELSLVEVK